MPSYALVSWLLVVGCFFFFWICILFVYFIVLCSRLKLGIWDSGSNGFCRLAGNVGADHAVFEQGASAGNVGNEKIVEQKKANPVALLLSSSMMLRHLQFPSFADRLETAVKRVIAEGKYRTKDLGGSSTTEEVVDAVLAVLDWPTHNPVLWNRCLSIELHFQFVSLFLFSIIVESFFGHGASWKHHWFSRIILTSLNWKLFGVLIVEISLIQLSLVSTWKKEKKKQKKNLPRMRWDCHWHSHGTLINFARLYVFLILSLNGRGKLLVGYYVLENNNNKNGILLTLCEAQPSSGTRDKVVG